MGRLKLAMTLTARDVEDVIEANLVYHLAQGVDVLIVTEHRSVDRTPEILERHAAQGKVHALRETRSEFVHTEVSSPTARMAASLSGALPRPAHGEVHRWARRIQPAASV